MKTDNERHYMEQSNLLDPLDAVVARWERRLGAAKQIRQLLSEFPELAEELRLALACSDSPVTRPARATGTRLTPVPATHASGTYFDRIKDFFEGHQNEWASAPRIGEITGISRGGVAHVLWRTHRDHFEQQPHAIHKKLKLWRLAAG